MVTLGSPKNIIEIIQKYQFAFQKKFSQSFLTDTYVLDKIISAAGTTGDDYVLEIGSGIGTMTQHLVEHAGKVVAVEIDTNLLLILDETLKDYSNVAVVDSDTLKLDMNQLVDEYSNERPIKVVANLPYYITTPIIMGLLEGNVPIDNITVMVQREVVDQAQVGPDFKDYGALSLIVQYYARPYIVANVPPDCFVPHPNVRPAVIRLTRYKEPSVQVDEPGVMFRLIRASFDQRRETLQNGSNNSPEVPYTKEQIAVAIESLGALASVRGGTLILEQFAGPSDYFTRTAENRAQGSRHDVRDTKTGSVVYLTGIKGNNPGGTII